MWPLLTSLFGSLGSAAGGAAGATNYAGIADGLMKGASAGSASEWDLFDKANFDNIGASGISPHSLGDLAGSPALSKVGGGGGGSEKFAGARLADNPEYWKFQELAMQDKSGDLMNKVLGLGKLNANAGPQGYQPYVSPYLQKLLGGL